jgi:hypothetical protein
MTKFVNMDYDASTNQWWIDAIPNYPTDTARVRTFYATESAADAYYNSIIDNFA